MAFKNQFPDFKPQFGNTRHIDILDKMKLYYKERERYEIMLMERKKNKNLYKKLKEMKGNIRKMIEFSAKNDP